jgi:tetratricopeptide (TPR) repeat protein
MIMGQYDNAIHNYKQALLLNPTLDKAKIGMANCFWAKGDFKTAYSIYSSIINSEHGDDKINHSALIYSRMAYMAYKVGDIPKAHLYIKKADETHGRQIESLMTIVDVATTMGLYDIAIRACDELINSSNDPQITNIARLKMKKLSSKQSF